MITERQIIGRSKQVIFLNTPALKLQSIISLPGTQHYNMKTSPLIPCLLWDNVKCQIKFQIFCIRLTSLFWSWICKYKLTNMALKLNKTLITTLYWYPYCILHQAWRIGDWSKMAHSAICINFPWGRWKVSGHQEITDFIVGCCYSKCSGLSLYYSKLEWLEFYKDY